MIHSPVVHEANIHDSVGAKLVSLEAKNKMTRLKTIWADSGYGGSLIWYVWTMFYWILEIVERTSKGFKVLSHRWIVERTFAWMNNYRGLSKDDEYSTISSKNTVYLAMLHRMLNNLAR